MARGKSEAATLNLFGATVRVTEDEEKKRRATAEKAKVEYVYCGECAHFERDKDGMSRDCNGIYFMGICAKGIHTDSPRKQFADKPRHCDEHEKRHL